MLPQSALGNFNTFAADVSEQLWQQAKEVHLAGRDSRPAWSFLTANEANLLLLGSPLQGQGMLFAAMAAWRISKAVFTFDWGEQDPAQPSIDKVSKDVLHELPGWCPYIVTPTIAGLNGFWVQLEPDFRGEETLVWHLDVPNTAPFLLPMQLKFSSLLECVGATEGLKASPPQSLEALPQMMSLVVYLCKGKHLIKGASGQSFCLPQELSTSQGGQFAVPSQLCEWTVPFDKNIQSVRQEFALL